MDDRSRSQCSRFGQLPEPGEFLDQNCLHCGYSLAGLPQSTDGLCPECGLPNERMPFDPVFTCEVRPGLWDAVRVAASMIGVIGLFMLLAVMTWIVVQSDGPLGMRLLIGGSVGIAGSVLPITALLIRREQRPDRVVVVDTARRTLTFKRFIVSRPWTAGRSTGNGLEVHFDDILGTEGKAVLFVTTPHGKLGVGSGFTHFRALTEVLYRVAPNPPPVHRSQVMDVCLAIGAIAAVPILIVIAISLGWL